MKWSLLGRRCQRGLSVYMPFSTRWPSDTTETPLAYGSLLSITHYISQIYYKPFLTVEVQFHLHNPLFHLPSSDAVGPYRAAVMVGLLSAHWQKTGAVDLRELEHISILFSRLDCEKKRICMHPMWIQKSMLHPSLTSSWAMTPPHIHYWSSPPVARLPIGLHAGLQASFDVQFLRNERLW